MSQQRLSPEEVIGQMSYAELQELLSELSMPSSLPEAVRLKRLVAQLSDVEAAIGVMVSPSQDDKKAA